MRSRLRAAFVLLLTVGLLAYFLRNANMASVWAETRHANAWLLLLVLGITLVTYAMQSLPVAIPAGADRAHALF